MVEVNSTFYAVPDARLVERWCRATPDDFIFDVKLHRLLSRHAAPAKSLPPALQRIAEIRRKGQGNTDREARAGPARADHRFDRAAARARTSSVPSCSSFRPFSRPESTSSRNWRNCWDGWRRLGRWSSCEIETGRTVKSWRGRWIFSGATRRRSRWSMHRTKHILRSCRASSMRSPIAELGPICDCTAANADAYLRGKTVAARFYYDYSDDEIDEVAERARKLARRGRAVCTLVFNNNALDFAPHAALRLRATLGQIAQGTGAPGRSFSLGARYHGSGSLPATTRNVGPLSKLVRPSAFSPRDDRGYATFDRARRGDRDLFWLHPALEPEDVALDCRGVVVQEQQDRGCDQRPTARPDPAVHAGDLPLGIQVWLSGRCYGRLPQRIHFRALGSGDYVHWETFFYRRPPTPGRLAHRWITLGGDRLFCLSRPGHEPPSHREEER